MLKAKYAGELEIIEGVKIPVAVLDSNERVISIRGFSNALGVKGGGAYWGKKRGNPDIAMLPEFVAAKNLQPYITTEIEEILVSTIPYKALNGQEAQGIKAEIIPKICDIWLRALNDGVLTLKQRKVAQQAHILLSAFAHVGIIALVDEVTGFQETRDKMELQLILKKYIAEALLPWTMRFPHEFYQEMFRLKGWEYNSSSKRKKPMMAGKLTKELIYDRLPDGVIEEIKRINPKRLSGAAKGLHEKHHHRFLTADVGNPHLDKLIASVTMLMKISPNWRKFESHYRRAFGGQQALDFDNDES